MNNAIPLCLPSNITPEQFLSNYWQKKPLLIKQGLPQLVNMYEPEDILGLSLEPEATARLIKAPANIAALTHNHTNDKWTVKNSPLTETDFDNLPNQWTVLVQNLEQWAPQLGALWQAFNFIPQWQRDDIMVSYAPKGGSVGKHYDDYDVFLAQGYGSRRWQLGKYCDENTAMLADQPLRIFDDMGEIIFDEILQAGDVLYVPPNLSHYGVAQDDCLTFSFGFRRPSLIQVLDNLVDVVTSVPHWFKPLMLNQQSQPAGMLSADSINQIKSALLDELQSPQANNLIAQAITEVVSKRQYDLLMPEDSVDTNELAWALQHGATIEPDASSKLIYIKTDNFDTDNVDTDNDIILFANGSRIDDLSTDERTLLTRIADGETLGAQQLLAKDSGITVDNIMTWLENGWVWLSVTDNIV